MQEFAFKIIATADSEGLVGRREELVRIRAESVETALDLAGYYALSAKCPDKDGWYFQCIEPVRRWEKAALTAIQGFVEGHRACIAA